MNMTQKKKDGVGEIALMTLIRKYIFLFTNFMKREFHIKMSIQFVKESPHGENE